MITRRSFLEKAVAAGTMAIVPACSSAEAGPASATLPAGSGPANPGASPSPDPSDPRPSPTPIDGGPAPSDGGLATDSCIEETEDDPLGPYYSPNPPKRSTLVEAGMPGTRLVVQGRVLGLGTTMTCAALAGAEVDVWHADDAGTYDNVGFTLRGIFTSDANGKYRIETILPGRYLDGGEYRPRHIHVRVRAPGRKELITQLYFDGDPFNATDGMFKPSLALETRDDGNGGLIADFPFVLA